MAEGFHNERGQKVQVVGDVRQMFDCIEKEGGAYEQKR